LQERTGKTPPHSRKVDVAARFVGAVAYIRPLSADHAIGRPVDREFVRRIVAEIYRNKASRVIINVFSGFELALAPMFKEATIVRKAFLQKMNLLPGPDSGASINDAAKM
jgi:hypothetical protein